MKVEVCKITLFKTGEVCEQGRVELVLLLKESSAVVNLHGMSKARKLNRAQGWLEHNLAIWQHRDHTIRESSLFLHDEEQGGLSLIKDARGTAFGDVIRLKLTSGVQVELFVQVDEDDALSSIQD